MADTETETDIDSDIDNNVETDMGADINTAAESRAQKPHRAGEPLVFEGYADDFEHNIAAIEFSLDNGATWTPYQTSGVVAEKGVNWHFVYTPEQPGRYLLKARAIDGQGRSSQLVSGFAFEVLP